MDILEKVSKEEIKNEFNDFKAGDTIKVHYNIKEGGKIRKQIFQGIVLQKRGSCSNKTFTVRKISHHGVSVEKIFPLYSPIIDKIEIVRKGQTRRAKLFYLRKMKGKSTKVKQNKKPIRNKEK